MVTESLQSLSSIYFTSCGIEGKSPDTVRSYAESLKIFMRAVERLGIPDDPGLLRPAEMHPHRFRHTFVTWAIELQAREIDVQRLLGHSTSAMLRRYTASYDAEKAAKAHASFSPGDRLATLPAA